MQGTDDWSYASVYPLLQVHFQVKTENNLHEKQQLERSTKALVYIAADELAALMSMSEHGTQESEECGCNLAGHVKMGLNELEDNASS